MNIPKHYTWDVIDSSKLSCFCDCPRQYFYSYILGWKLDRPEHDLWFGEAWHRAREHQLIHGYDDVPGAYSKFIDCYREKFGPGSDDMFRPKDPSAVAIALGKFADERKLDLIENELLFTETAIATGLSTPT